MFVELHENNVRLLMGNCFVQECTSPGHMCHAESFVEILVRLCEDPLINRDPVACESDVDCSEGKGWIGCFLNALGFSETITEDTMASVNICVSILSNCFTPIARHTEKDRQVRRAIRKGRSDGARKIGSRSLEWTFAFLHVRTHLGYLAMARCLSICITFTKTKVSDRVPLIAPAELNGGSISFHGPNKTLSLFTASN